MLKPLVLLFLSITLLVGCEKDEIPLADVNFTDTPNIYDIVIEGGILSKKEKQFLRLSKPLHWLNPNEKPEINGASVSVSDGKDTFFYEEAEISGDYYTKDSICGTVGTTYTLTVKYNGKTYTASDTMTEAEEVSNKLPAINSNSNEELNLVSYNMKIHSFGFHKSIRMICNVKSDSESSLSVKQMITGEIYGCFMFHKGSPPQGVFPDDYKIIGIAARKTHPVEVFYFSISDKYYEFLLSLYNETVWASGFFSPIPGNIKTNVSEGGTGFFFASDVKSKIFSITDFEIFD